MSKFIAAVLMLFSSVLVAAEPHVYVVRSGDTLSQIAQQRIGSPIYIHGGSLEKVLSLNPEISNRDRLVVGQRIVIGKTIQTEVAPASKSPVIPALVATSRPTVKSSTPAVEVSRKVASSEEATPKVEAREPEEIPHRLTWSAAMGLTTLSGTDTRTGGTATLSTAYDLTVGAGWRQDWARRFSTEIGASARSIEFQPSSGGTKSLVDARKTAFALSVAGTGQITERFGLNLGARFANQLYIRGNSVTTVTVDSVAVPQFSVGSEYRLVKMASTSVELHADFGYLLGASTDGYSIENGTRYRAGLALKRRYGNDNDVEFDISFRSRSQKTSVVDMQENSVIGTLSFGIPLFEDRDQK